MFGYIVSFFVKEVNLPINIFDMNAEEIKKELSGKLEELKSDPGNTDILVDIVELYMKLEWFQSKLFLKRMRT